MEEVNSITAAFSKRLIQIASVSAYSVSGNYFKHIRIYEAYKISDAQKVL